MTTIAEQIHALTPDRHRAQVTEEGARGNVYFRSMRFEEPGGVVRGHTHHYDHVTFLWRGAVHLRAYHTEDGPGGQRAVGDPIEHDYAAPARILIKKDMWHEFTALEPDTAADCIYAVRDHEGAISEEYDGRQEPYC